LGDWETVCLTGDMADGRSMAAVAAAAVVAEERNSGGRHWYYCPLE
jgi:hypothetical protein